MSTNKSTNLNLHLWAPEDDFLRTEFNENFEAIDTAVKADRDAIATVQSAAQTAQTAANNAQSTANAAYSGNKVPYVIGSYTGTGKSGASNPNTLSFGFKPRMLIIQDHSTLATDSVARIYFAGQSKMDNIFFTWTNTGVSWYADGVKTQLNVNQTYYYIAFR